MYDCRWRGILTGPSETYDSSFKPLYKSIALHPGYINARGKLTNPVIKKWDGDIAIYVEGVPERTAERCWKS
jgi:hypothetical protein